MRKGIQMSEKCNQKCFIYIFDQDNNEVIHYSSSPSFNLVNIFNGNYKRQYYTNSDYEQLVKDAKTENQLLQQPECENHSKQNK